MREDISKVLQMMERGTIDSERAAELIELIKENETIENNSPKDYLNRSLKIRVSSEDHDNVNVNLPLGIVRTFLKAGRGIAMNVPQAEEYMQDIDVEMLIDAIDNELVGEIINVETEDATVHIYIE